MPGETPASIGPYEIVGELGRGGMGVVYRARRADLNRDFALKVIRAGEQDEADALQRFRREAQAAAALSDHPGIVGVHDIGDDGGRVFFAMDLVEGESLEQAIDGGELLHTQAAEWIEQAARAVHYAHQRGVLHRDIKPGNILIGPDGGARVTDFGLAQVQDAGPDVTRLTKSGVILGTPAYMPPEQTHGGGGVDARADVYALGASLYECLVGEPPFTGDTVLDVLGRVMREEARPAMRRDPRIPAALSVIAAKCLEKDPQRRYQTAEALAEDLARWRRGEPIVAKPPSVAFRAARWLRRNRPVAVAALAVVVAAGAFLAYGAAQRRVASADAAVLRQLRERTGLALRAALSLRRAGQLHAMEEYLAETERACREAALEAHPEPHYRLGQMYRALGRWDEALVAQGRALALQPDHGGALYERVVLRFGAHGRRERELARLARREAGRRMFTEDGRADPANAPERPPTGAELARDDAAARALRDGIVADLAVLLAPDAASRDITAAQLACARGLHAVLQEQPAAARALLEEAVRADPNLVAPLEALAGMANAEGAPEEAIRWWSQGIAHDAGYLPFVRGRIAAARQAAAWTRQGEPAVKSHLDQAEADARRLLELRPDTEAHIDLAWVRWERGQRLDRSAGAKIELYGESLEALRVVLQSDPKNPALLEIVAQTEQGLGYQRMRGEAGTPLPYLADSIATYGRLLELEAGRANLDAWTGRASSSRALARWHIRQGRDPGTLLDDAQRDLDEAVRVDPSDINLWAARARLQSARAELVVARGEDPRPLLTQGAKEIAESLRQHPRSAYAWWVLGTLQSDAASYVHNELRGDARAAFGQALASFTQSVECEPKDPAHWAARGELRDSFAIHLEQLGLDSVPMLRDAIRDFDEALAMEQNLAGPWNGRGKARVRLAMRLLARGEPAGTLLADAVADNTRAVALQPRRAAFWASLGDAQRRSAMAYAVGHADALPAFRKALASLDRAVELAEGHAETRVSRAMARTDFCPYLSAAGEAVQAVYAGAVEDCKAALAKSESVMAYEVLARAHLNWGSHQQKRKEDPRAAFRDAVAAGTRATEISDRSADGWALRAEATRYIADWTRFNAGREPAQPLYEESVRCYGRAVNLAPGNARWRTGRGGALVNYGNMLRRLGRDPTPQYDTAVADLSRAAELSPGSMTNWWFLGNACSARAMWKEHRGLPHAADYRAAIRAFERAIRLGPHLRRTLEPRIADFRKRADAAEGK
ncbi:MAG: protein kinase domain-containing protein [Planctomycetota bacterium]|jgi:serine/threonine-protein kinase